MLTIQFLEVVSIFEEEKIGPGHKILEDGKKNQKGEQKTDEAKKL